MQDTTKGQIKTYVGPIVINQTGQERPVAYDERTRLFQSSQLERAVVKNILAGEGDYIVLENPPENGNQPEEASVQNSPNLRNGMKVNIPGPISFALWPMQSAHVIPGHNLRSNQYLIVRIYNEEQAKQNWTKAVMKKASESQESSKVTADDLTIGKHFIIKGTEVSFYIPPTGVEVVVDGRGNYVREAVTLERLEYCILIDENGNKRYEKGPQVVFPSPTEVFFEEDGCRKFKAEELTGIQGLHIKVIADYKEDEVPHKVGEELFLTGEQCAIYYPRPEHSIIQYGKKRKYYATAVPVGEGRYILNRNSGVIRTERGPNMLLPDPRFEVMVRRVLTDKECQLWYPGNREALSYNQNLRSMSRPDSGNYVAESDMLERGFTNAATVMLAGMADAPAKRMATPDSFERGTTYTPPRQITLDTKYEGVPAIRIWTGYAVQVVNKRSDGQPERRVVQGPANLLLDYDETLEVLELSTGKPKSTDRLEHTVYLRVSNNKVSDIIQGVYTKDHVPVSIKLSYRVNFEGDPNQWFNVENYVKFLCDHIRSVVKGNVRRMEIRTFHADGSAILRDIILGTKDESTGKRPGCRFSENGMVVTDVEVLEIRIDDPQIDQMLDDAQHQVVASDIDLDRSEKNLIVSQRKQQIAREMLQAEHETVKVTCELELDKTAQLLAAALAKVEAQVKEQTRNADLTKAKQTVLDIEHQAQLNRQKQNDDRNIAVEQQEADLRLKQLTAEVEGVVKKFESAQKGFSEALLVLSNNEALTKIAQAASVQTLIGGSSVVDALQQIFQGVNLGDTLKKLAGDGQVPAARR
jgi:major vault protein